MGWRDFGALFTPTEKTKLSGIEDSATADQTGAEIKTAYEAESDTNAFTDELNNRVAALKSAGNPAVVETASGSYVVAKTMTVRTPGKYKLYWDTGTSNTSSTVQTAIFRSDVQVGTEKSDGNTSGSQEWHPNDDTPDIFWASGDVIQFKYKETGPSYARMRNPYAELAGVAES